MILIRRMPTPASATHPPAGSVYHPDLFLENHNRKRPPKHHPFSISTTRYCKHTILRC